MRNAFIDELVSAAKNGKEVALVVGDLGYKVVEPFADSFPDRFFNAGIAEQNMMGLSAGLASEGVHVFAYSIANFPTFRCAEQIRNDVAYHNLPVTVVSVGGGVAYGALGYSHHAVQDYALMRVMPNMLIAAPGDPMEVRACMRYLISMPGPSFLRLGKAGEPCFHQDVPTVVPGEWLEVRQSEDKSSAFVSTGAALQIAMDRVLKNEYMNFNVYSLPLWSMAEKNIQKKQLERHKIVITLEDHLIDGGFGSWMLEAQSIHHVQGTRVYASALSAEVCGTVGSQEVLNRLGGLLG